MLPGRPRKTAPNRPKSFPRCNFSSLKIIISLFVLFYQFNIIQTNQIKKNINMMVYSFKNKSILDERIVKFETDWFSLLRI